MSHILIEMNSLEVKKCLKSTFVSSAGNMTKIFENKINHLTKSKFSIALINGTSALHLSFKSLGIKNNDEVLTPSLTLREQLMQLL